jgi:hypothetical protein
VRFSPKTSPGTLTADLRISSNATTGAASVTLSGIAAEPLPVLLVSPTSVRFGNVGHFDEFAAQGFDLLLDAGAHVRGLNYRA